MKLYNNRQNINFKAGLTPQHIDFIKNLNVEKVTSDLQKNHGIFCRFSNNTLTAGLTSKTVDIFEKLGCQTPKQVRVFDFLSSDVAVPENVRNAIGYVTFSDKDTSKCRRVNLNKLFFDFAEQKLAFLDVYFKYFQAHSGTDHVLQPIIHEFIHVNHYLRVKDSMPVRDIKKMTDLKFINLWEEVTDKFGYYSTENPFELYANYWTKEICESLDENWLPKYNPFETPKIKISKKLKKFIAAVEQLDFKSANKAASRWDDKLFNIFS